ncbi:hypothetical protein LVJ82_00535 [Vitreoscilla massiliensis]|uniref:Uncharacterized protein n=1 Tax=Vitreoscilla massiliensis TaxID=1689272 RepID=A0ABY4E127_9NEIS|nr:hypothetical protein [Vitreoscilla massiliensis]UOO89501.1 hypothetical protein LVJ82_00535 [Vitreoscilla massiliensis]
MADAELTAKLKLDAEEFEKKVKSSTQAAEELAKRVGDSASSLNDQQKALLKSAKDAGYYFDAQGRLHDQTGKYAKQNDELGQKLKALQAELKRTGKEAEILETGLQKAGNASQKIDVGGKGTSFKVGAMAGAVGGAVGGVIGGVVSGVTSAIVSNAQQIIVSGIQRINAEAAKAATVLIDSSRLNVDTRTLQEWTYAAGKMNINADKMGDIFKDTNDKIGDFVRTGGGEAKDIIETLNLDVRELIGLSPDKVLMRIAKESEGLNAQDRTFLFEAIADEASALLPLLDDGAAKMQAFKDQAQREGRILSDGQLQAMKSYKESLDSLISRAEAFAAQVAGNLAKPLEILTNEFNKLIDQYGGAEGAAQSFAKVMIETAASGVQAFGYLIEQIANARKLMADASGTVANLQYEWAEGKYRKAVMLDPKDPERIQAKADYETAKANLAATIQTGLVAEDFQKSTKTLADNIKNLSKNFEEKATVAIDDSAKEKSTEDKIATGLQKTFQNLQEQYQELLKQDNQESKAQAQEVLAQMKQIESQLKAQGLPTSPQTESVNNSEQIEATKNLIESTKQQLEEMKKANALSAQEASVADKNTLHAQQIAVQNRLIELQNKLVDLESKKTDKSTQDYDNRIAVDAAKDAAKAEEAKGKELDKRNKELLKEQQDQLKLKQKLDMDDAKSKDAATKEQSAASKAFNESVRSFGQSVDKQANGKVLDANGKEVPQIQAFYGSDSRPAAVQKQQQFNNATSNIDQSMQNLGVLYIASQDGKQMAKVLATPENVKIIKQIAVMGVSEMVRNGAAANT